MVLLFELELSWLESYRLAAVKVAGKLSSLAIILIALDLRKRFVPWFRVQPLGCLAERVQAKA